jgi:4a-hydroxytetrahydrobiopterin dehydratase
VAKQAVVTDAEVLDALAGADGPAWHLVGGKLIKSVACGSFPEALAFVTEVGRLAEEQNHHPDIDIRYDRVTLALVTHDSGGITRLDLELAGAIDGIELGRPA